MAYQSILNPMPAILSGGTNVIGALTANQSVNHTQLAGTAIATGTGISGAGVQRMTLATDIALPAGGNVIGAVTQSGTWNVGTITTLPALPTGGNVIGSVTQSGTWNIGTITTLPALATGANTIGNVGLIAGAAAIGSVSVTALPALVAGSAIIGSAKITDGTNTVGIATGAGAGNEVSFDRLKVNAEVKILDTTQLAGSQIVAAKGDQASGLWVNVKSTGELPELYFLNAILTELKVISTLLQVGLSVVDDPGTLRDDYSNQLN